MLKKTFFNRDPAIVAKKLLGKILRVNHKGTWLAAQIIETEAYYIHEKGSHSSLGFTEKRKALFMPAGTIYMYHAHGGDSLNISCQGKGNAVLIKSGIPYLADAPQNMLSIMRHLNPNKDGSFRNANKLCAGQTLVCKSLGLKVRDWDAKNFDPNKFYIDDVGYQAKKIIKTTRLGIPPGRDEHLKLRFIAYDFATCCTSNPLTKRNWQQGKEFHLLKNTH